MRLVWILMACSMIQLSACAELQLSPPVSDAGAGDRIPVAISAAFDGFQYRAPKESFSSLKNKNVVIQQFDYSCGTGALATVFRYYLGLPVSEEYLLVRYLDALRKTPEGRKQAGVIVEEGLSLLDLFKIATEIEYRLDGKTLSIKGAVLRIPLEKMAKIKAPAIVRIEKAGFLHFVAFRGVVGDRVYLADPSRGNLRLSKTEFLKQWSGESLYLGYADRAPERYPLDLVDAPEYPIERFSVRQAILQ